jgi:hypothetical protein
VTPATKLQLPEELNVPVPLERNDTDPVGVVAPELEVSVTVAVQLVPTLTVTEDGTQFTLVEVGWMMIGTVIVTEYVTLCI